MSRLASCQAASQPAKPAPITFAGIRFPALGVGFLLIVAQLILRQEPGAFFVYTEGFHPPSTGFLKQRLPALRAVLGGGHVPGHKATLSPLLAGVIGVALLRLPLQHAAAAFRAPAWHTFHNGLGVFALRIPGAGHKAAKTAHLDDHLSTAQLANLIGFLIGHLQSRVLQGLLRVLLLLMETLVEVP